MGLGGWGSLVGSERASFFFPFFFVWFVNTPSRFLSFSLTPTGRCCGSTGRSPRCPPCGCVFFLFVHPLSRVHRHNPSITSALNNINQLKPKQQHTCAFPKMLGDNCNDRQDLAIPSLVSLVVSTFMLTLGISKEEDQAFEDNMKVGKSRVVRCSCMCEGSLL